VIRVVRLGSKRAANEGVRLGTVRKPPRGVPKAEYAKRNIYDVWLPTLAPSDALLKQALRISETDERGWQQFFRKYRAEMKAPAARHLLDALAALSQQTNFSVGCYCAKESHCHRSVLRQLLIDCGAKVAPAPRGDKAQ
jgi:uncharacterized protein YeaO (DUF488 family)